MKKEVNQKSIDLLQRCLQGKSDTIAKIMDNFKSTLVDKIEFSKTIGD